MAILNVDNINKRPPLSFIRFKRVYNIAMVPVIVLTLKGLWEGSDVQLNKILLIITVTMPGLLEAIGLLIAPDETKVDTDNVKSVTPKSIAPDM